MDKILLAGNISWFGVLIETCKKKVPDLFITGNFEEVNARIKLGQVERVCIVQSAFNFSGNSSNNASGSEAAKAFHKMVPSIPILVWNDINIEFPIQLVNELYLDCGMYETPVFYRIMKEFYSGMFPPPSI